MIQKRKIMLPCPLCKYQGMRPPLSNQDGVEKWTSVSTFSNTDLNGNQNQQCPNLGPSDTTSIKAKPKIEKKKTKMVQKRVQGSFILLLLCIRKPIKKICN